MKLRKLHIEDYKMFKDFDISFVDENDEALPIIVLAGVNGSGKTTLLEFIYKNLLSLDSVDANNIEIEINNVERIFSSKYNSHNFLERKELFQTQLLNELYTRFLVYLPSGIDDTQQVADEFVKTFYYFLKEKDYRPSEVKNHFDEYMQQIFDGLDLTFSYSHLDKEDNVWFTNGNGKEFQIDGLSTGEKTLLSKILYIYFKDYKDKVILIDEPELSLHPKWQNQILSVYKKLAERNNCQIIIATHSPQIIGSAKNEYLRLLVKEENQIVVKELSSSPLDRDTNTILKTLMGANYLPQELEKLRYKYRELFNQELENTAEAKKLEKEILEWESPNSSFWQGLAFDKELRSI